MKSRRRGLSEGDIRWTIGKYSDPDDPIEDSDDSELNEDHPDGSDQERDYHVIDRDIDWLWKRVPGKL